MTGIDISAVQGPQGPAGNWEFIVVKLSEAQSTPNFDFDTQWAAAARTTRGVYHYARPALSNGATQANYFAGVALAKGFRPGIDIWQLDAEDGENAGVNDWRDFIDTFMTVALRRLGARGFLYAGWPFLRAHGIADLPFRYMWWLPDYARNDGVDHGWNSSVTAPVVIHQFTSTPFDKNTIINVAAYLQAPVPTPGVIVPQFNPPIVVPGGIAASAKCPIGGEWLVGYEGHVYAFDGAPYHGGVAGQPYWGDRKAAKIEAHGVGVQWGYTITATSGETYTLP